MQGAEQCNGVSSHVIEKEENTQKSLVDSEHPGASAGGNSVAQGEGQRREIRFSSTYAFELRIISKHSQFKHKFKLKMKKNKIWQPPHSMFKQITRLVSCQPTDVLRTTPLLKLKKKKKKGSFKKQ